MKQEEIEQILLEEPRLLPSGHFAATVMDAVYREHRARAPLPFPWVRLLLGMGVCVALSVVGLVNVSKADDVQQIDVLPIVAAIEHALLSPEVAWSVGSLAGSALLVWLTLGLVSWMARIKVSSGSGFSS